MKLGKRFVHSRAVTAIISWLLSLYIRFVFVTSRVENTIDPLSKPYVDGERNAIFAFWHGRMMMIPVKNPAARNMHILISHHRDGMFISRVIAHFGVATIGGSTSRGAEKAAREILDALKRGDNIGITPDGPRGPAQKAGRGFIAMARLSGTPLIPVTFSASRCVRLKSWDRFMLALPFGRIIFCAGAPIMVEKDADEEQARQQMEEAMNRLCDMADTHVT